MRFCLFILLNELQIARDVADTLTAVVDILDGVLRGLPALDVYVQIFGASRIRLLEKPLVGLYAELILFGMEAAKLFGKPIRREFFTLPIGRRTYGVSRFRLVYKEFATNRYHAIDH